MENRYCWSISNLILIIICGLGVGTSCKGEMESNAKIVDVTTCELLPIYDMFDSLEVISLDTVPESELGNYTLFYGCQDYYIIKSNKLFYIFDKNGNFISNTKKILGHGKGESPILIGCEYNPYSDQIEILSIDKLLKYDSNLNFISEHKLPYDPGNKNPNINSGSWFNFIYDLSGTDHIMMPSGGLMNSHNLYCYNSNKDEIVGQSTFKEDVISTYGSWQYSCFCNDNSNIYIFPPCITKKFYKFDLNSKEITSFLEFDFGSSTLTKEDLKPYMSNDYIENQSKIFSYLSFDCNKHYPIRSTVTNNKLFSLIHTDIQSNNWYLLEVNLEDLSVKKLNIANEGEEVFSIDFTSSDGYVYTIDNDEQRIKNYISSFKSQDRIKYSGISDSLDCNNAVVLKYKVK